jgi:pimeloyl-ACP methyl ester carboxylesterase
MGTVFQHVLFWCNGGPNRTLHVYLGGDGTPVSAGRPAKDPTPRNPLMLRLMRLDSDPAVYIGRPCYHGLAETAGCSGDLWTAARYSESVVASLAAAIRRIMMSRGYERVSLFGHSGGGTLAMLLAERFPEVRAIVTIAANLDIDAWADHHGQDRIAASLNPASRPPLLAGILVRHYAGSNDRIVLPALVAPGVRGANAKLIVVDGYDHVCCWTELWPTILADIAAAER